MENIITLCDENIDQEHICCAISDKKCRESYEAKKTWLKKEFENGYVFKRIDARAKVFIEYGPAEMGWAPVVAPNFFLLNCFWVSGKYKGHGYAKELLKQTLADAETQGKDGLVTVVGTKKLHFMSDGKWFLRQGFTELAHLDYGFSLLVRKLNPESPDPYFGDSVKTGVCDEKNGLVAYYSNRCPFAEYHVLNSLRETATKRGLPLKTIKLTNYQEAQSAPTPASVFSLFHGGKFVTTDISVCMDSRFDKIMTKSL